MASSHLFGFKNYTSGSTVVNISSQTITAGHYVVASGTISLQNIDAVSSVKLQYASVEAFWRQAQGFTTTGVVSSQYSLQSNTYYSAGNLVVDTYAVNQTGGNITLPAQIINVSVRLFRSPFAN